MNKVDSRVHKPGTPSAAEIVVATTRDPAECELASRPWELLCRPQSTGDFLHRITAIKFPESIVYLSRYSLPVHIQGLSPEGMLVFSVPLGYAEEPLYWGSARADCTMPTMLPGPLDVRLSHGHAQLVAMVTVKHLRQVMPEESYERFETAARSRFFPLPPPVISAFAQWGCELLDAVESRPGMFNNPTVCEEILQELISHLLQISANLPPQRPISSLPARQLGLGRALEYLRYRMDSRLSIEELYRVAGVSERTLRYAFREEYGLSPTEFMRRRRLHAVRRQLNTSDREHTTVSEVAARYGFTELGRFAAEYRRLFGVRPSDSLRSCR